MFAILDTDHFSAVDRESTVAQVFHRKRREYVGELFITIITIITVEEVMRGWLSLSTRINTQGRIAWPQSWVERSDGFTDCRVR